jgi:hypothetical protein
MAKPKRATKTKANQARRAGKRDQAVANGNVNAGLVPLTYMGHYRKAVKTSVALGSAARIADLGALLDSLPSDASMRKKYNLKARTIAQKRQPPKGAIGPLTRFPEEMKNVVIPCWICAVKFETGQKDSDNDCHVILSSTANSAAQSARFMTAEVSGLPTGGKDVATLKAARQQLVALFRTVKLGNRFYQPSPPIKVRVTGSLFFDGDHNPGNIGPAGKRPRTTWEIHPVTAISKV